MPIDWSIVATVGAPLLALFAGVAIERALERRPKLVSYVGHVSAHMVQQQNGQPLNIYTHSLVLKNSGRKPAKNVRISHFYLPNFNIYPSIQHHTENLSAGGSDIVIPTLIPQQMITISYIYQPPITWEKINGDIRSDEGFAKKLSVLPTIQYPGWLNAIVVFFMLVGLVTIAYLVFSIVVDPLAPGFSEDVALYIR